MNTIFKPKKTEAEAREFVIYARDTYGIRDVELLARVVDRDKAQVLKWLKEKSIAIASPPDSGK